MIKVNWLVEEDIFDRHQEFIEVLYQHGYPYQQTTYLKCISTVASAYYKDEDCVIFRGTLSLGRNILKTPWIPGAYLDEKNLRCSTYYNYFGKYLLNNKYFYLSLKELIRRKEEILAYFSSDGEIFIRPDSNMKPFNAGAFNLNKLNTVQALTSELNTDEKILVLVSKKQPITKEWRFFVHKNEVITGSLYLVGEERINETIKGGHLKDYLTQILVSVNWYPEALYTVDICESKGELYVLELGSYSCAGEYGCDLNLIIEAGAEAAIEEYEAML
jgi:ATP-grasp domain, R2K clade family 2